MLEKYLFVFFVAMVPVIELRGAIPIGLGLGLDVLPTYIVAVVGNMVPVPVIYLFARKFLIWGYHKPLIGGICKFFVVKGEKAGRALEAKAGRGLSSPAWAACCWPASSSAWPAPDCWAHSARCLRYKEPSPSQSAGASCATSPAGGGKNTPVGFGRARVRRTCSGPCLTAKLPGSDGGTLGSPYGGAVSGAD